MHSRYVSYRSLIRLCTWLNFKMKVKRTPLPANESLTSTRTARQYDEREGSNGAKEAIVKSEGILQNLERIINDEGPLRNLQVKCCQTELGDARTKNNPIFGLPHRYNSRKVRKSTKKYSTCQTEMKTIETSYGRYKNLHNGIVFKTMSRLFVNSGTDF